MYFNGDIMGHYDREGHYRFRKSTSILCDSCAETAIPLPPETPENKGRRHWSTGFKWAPYYGAHCTECGRPV